MLKPDCSHALRPCKIPSCDYIHLADMKASSTGKQRHNAKLYIAGVSNSSSTTRQLGTQTDAACSVDLDLAHNNAPITEAQANIITEYALSVTIPDTEAVQDPAGSLKQTTNQ